jgi:hypothetical protein
MKGGKMRNAGLGIARVVIAVLGLFLLGGTGMMVGFGGFGMMGGSGGVP